MTREYFLRLSEKERNDLEIVLKTVLGNFDFHGDLRNMQIPVLKLLQVINDK